MIISITKSQIQGYLNLDLEHYGQHIVWRLSEEELEKLSDAITAYLIVQAAERLLHFFQKK